VSQIEKFLIEFSGLFEHKKRDIGKKFVCLNDNATDSDRDFIRECHGTEMLPDDFRYNTIESIIDSLKGTLDFSLIENDLDLFESDAQNSQHEICDSLVDVYNHDLLTWLSSNLNRPNYIDEARDEGLISEDCDEMNRIMIGQFKEIEEIFYNIISAIKDLDFDEPDEEFEPEESDAYIVPCGNLGSKTSLSIEQKFIGEYSSDDEAIEAFKEHCKTNQYWPNLWQVSDHGNHTLLTVDHNEAVKDD